uniref:Phosphoribosyltransferase domain-containing protein n=1 Tax=viral metagenome TaxID=1070528 RepID=A0A6M3LRM0_9ZZZZ
MYGHSSYLKNTFDPELFQRTVNSTVERVKQLQKELQFDSLAFTGQSGASVAYPVSFLTGLKLICIRKISSHGFPVEQSNDCGRYLIIDDFVCSGATIDFILNKLRDFPFLTCVGIFCYYNSYSKKASYKELTIFSN